jgi:hypothetical protein
MLWTKTSFGFSKFASSSLKQPPQNQDCNKKNEKQKKWGSKMASILPTGGTCEKLREVFVLHPLRRKTSLGFSKLFFVFPESASEDDMLNRQKWAVFKKLGKAVFWGKVVFRTPPEVVSGFRGGGGGGVRWLVELPSVQEWFYETTHIGPPLS